MSQNNEASEAAKVAAGPKMVKVKLNKGVVHKHAGDLYQDEAEITMSEHHAKWLVEERARATYVK